MPTAYRLQLSQSCIVRILRGSVPTNPSKVCQVPEITTL
jgi:hypothetical protein